MADKKDDKKQEPAKPPEPTKKTRKGGKRSLPQFTIYARNIKDNKEDKIDVASGTREAKAIARTLQLFCAEKYDNIRAVVEKTMTF